MKLKYYFIVFIVLFLIPFNIYAVVSPDYVYNILKNEAENNGLAKEYTGTHHDSFTEEPTEKIYHWYAENDEEGIEINNKNNVLFAGQCFRILRTTDTGGVKLMYLGKATDNKCETLNDQRVRGFAKNPYELGAVGYKTNYSIHNESSVERLRQPYRVGSDVEYSNGKYTLIDMQNSIDYNHHYVCNSEDGTCTNVIYICDYDYGNNSLYSRYILSGGYNITEAIAKTLHDDNVNLVDSKIKEYVDSWYIEKLSNYSSYLEDTIFCNDRSIIDLGPFDPNGGSYSGFGYMTFKGTTNDINLRCNRDTDSFSVNNPKAKLTYPAGIATSSEMNLFNNDQVRKTGKEFWLITPYFYFNNGAYITTVASDGSFNSRHAYQTDSVYTNPVISLKKDIVYINGDGSKSNPYIVKELVKSNISIDNDSSKGEVIINETSSITEGTDISFSINVNEGYLLDKIEIKDSNNNDIEYTNENSLYSFTMPNSNVTIKPIYKKVKSSINIVITNETKDINIELNDLTSVEYNEEVRFSVNAITGYELNDITITDENNNTINYTLLNNKNEFSFIMPATSVTIKPSYSKVKSHILVENQDHIKELKIQVNDVEAVVYDDIVRFIVIPENGYVLDYIDILDLNGNKISYKKTNNDYEYEFKMVETDVTITPYFKKIEVPNNPKTNNILLIFFGIFYGFIYMFFFVKGYSLVFKEYLNKGNKS